MNFLKALAAAAAAALPVGVLLVLPSARAAAQRPTVTVPAVAQRACTRLLTALKTDDYAAFVADSEDAFKQNLTKPVLDQVSARVAPRLKAGYQASYLTELHQKGYQVYLWKITYTDGGDDSLASLSLKAGKVGGFFLN